MKQFTQDEAKIGLIERLIKDNNISFREALSLLEVEVKTEYVYYPPYYPTVNIPSVFDFNKITYAGTTYTDNESKTYTINN